MLSCSIHCLLRGIHIGRKTLRTGSRPNVHTVLSAYRRIVVAAPTLMTVIPITIYIGNRMALPSQHAKHDRQTTNAPAMPAIVSQGDGTSSLRKTTWCKAKQTQPAPTTSMSHDSAAFTLFKDALLHRQSKVFHVPSSPRVTLLHSLLPFKSVRRSTTGKDAVILQICARSQDHPIMGWLENAL